MNEDEKEITINIEPMLKQMKNGEKSLSELIAEKLQEVLPWNSKN